MTDSPPRSPPALVALSGLPGVGKTTIAGDYCHWDSDRLVVDTARLDVTQSVQRIVSALALDSHVA